MQWNCVRSFKIAARHRGDLGQEVECSVEKCWWNLSNNMLIVIDFSFQVKVSIITIEHFGCKYCDSLYNSAFESELMKLPEVNLMLSLHWLCYHFCVHVHSYTVNYWLELTTFLVVWSIALARIEWKLKWTTVLCKILLFCYGGDSRCSQYRDVCLVNCRNY